MRLRRWLAALVAPLAACGAGTGPGADASVAEDGSHDAGRDAARDADVEPGDAGDPGSDAGTCDFPGASYYRDSGPRSADGGALMILESARLDRCTGPGMRVSWLAMHALKAQVKNGRIVVDEPTDLPDGTVVDLVVADTGDDLDDEERGELHAAIDEGLVELRSASGIAAADVLARLRSKQ